ncbi:hydroxymyristoyl-ACP dehydratase [Dysgonomonas sp. Marseille-P4677]|uniref:hydroxymyristoyl-ACP dehydratase n=1 Tax=Dysgonomonas sp. Marseille-P4677 TaxID=2364790 RepID=UPI001913C75F|nr:hydroxymyristoyl-ACP dehydratase [Dysgonomonas sp. Marseille-P4677]MBK5720094.1 hydroxymyristoyl-ACP dehydratase [Dysgonomonas sp. Marseille-P4677]
MKNQAIIEGNSILDLIPQRPPIVMVDKFYGIEENTSYTGLTITVDNIFVENNKLKEPGIIEHIAQSAASRIGYICQQENIDVPLGFIGSVDKLTIHSLPLVEDNLHTEIKIIQEVAEITLISASVRSGNSLIAECRMKIFLKKE